MKLMNFSNVVLVYRLLWMNKKKWDFVLTCSMNHTVGEMTRGYT